MSQVSPSPFGKISPSTFLKRHWQRKPLLVRGAFTDFASTLEPFKPEDVLALSRREDAESRLVTSKGGKWALQHGPFSRAAQRQLGERDWTILVQDTQHFSAAASTLLTQFSFLPHVRVDDLMVSLAAPGGGVGPHVDSYDVFLIQGKGRRRWRISGQTDRDILPDLPLKILRKFKPESDWILESGDMLYLPPGYAHEGVALDECLTYSVGFRAPRYQEWAESFLDQLRDDIEVPGQYEDAGIRMTTSPGEIPTDMLRRFESVLNDIKWRRETVATAVGRFLTEPKGHVQFEPAGENVDRVQFRKLCQLRGLRLDGKTRMAYRGESVFINGEWAQLPSRDSELLKALANQRFLPPCKPGSEAISLLHDWFDAGYLHVSTD